LPGMTAHVRIVIDKRDGVLKVPNAALRFRPAAELAASAPSPAARSPRTEGAPGERMRGQGREGAGRAQVARGRIYLQDAKGELIEKEVELGLSDGLSTEVRAEGLAEG